MNMWKTTMKTISSLLLAAICLLCAAMSWADTDEVVVTIYFAGTNLDSSMWAPNDSPYGRSETIATLHRAQEDQPHHHKGIVDGIDQSFNGDPFQPNWNAQLNVAESIFDNRPDCSGQCVILNLVGFSRGAVSTMHTARKMVDDIDVDNVIKKINIFAMDPVPGDGLLATGIDGNNFQLPAIADYVGFYANDERSVGFAPIIPASSGNDHVDFFRVPGAHNTMIGSAFKNGHRDDHDNDVGRLDPLPRTLRIVAMELLASAAWGHVRFNPNVHSGLNLDWTNGETNVEVLRQRFIDNHLKPIFNSYYGFMREFSLVAPLSVDLREGWTDGNCRSAGTADKARLSERCVYTGGYNFALPLGQSDGPIDEVSSVKWLNAQGGGDYLLWQLIEQRGFLDTDFDGVDYSLDNCRAVANPDQRDTDSDGIGNLCDADLNNDCIVNAVDLGLFRLRFFSNDPTADFNGDGVVNAIDLGQLRLAFFGAPGPSATGCAPGGR